MNNKGTIRLFTIALALVCVFYMSFSVVTYIVKNNAKNFAGDNLEKENRYLDSMETEEVYNIGIANYTYGECKRKQLNLGLDLQGGMHVTVEVDLDKMIKRLSGNPQNELLNKALIRAKEMQRTSQAHYVDLFRDAFNEVSNGTTLFSVFDTRENRGRFNRDAVDKDLEVVNYIKKESDAAIERTTDILRSRIDKFGVTQPTMRQESSGRITIELPGIDDAERIRKLLQSTAKLEFWETYELKEIYPYIEKVNTVLASKLAVNEPTNPEDSGKVADPVKDVADILTDGDESSVAKDSLGNDIEGSISETSVIPGDSQSKDSVNKNDSNSLAQKDFLKKNPLYKYLQLAVSQQGEFNQGPVVGYANSKDTVTINNYLNDEAVLAVLPSDAKFMWEAKPVEEGRKVYRLLCLKTAAGRKAPLTGSVITDAITDFDPFTGKPGVTMTMNGEGAKIWRNLTGKNVNRSVAIALDGAIYSYPNVNGEISGGRSQITGNFDIKEAKDLANILKAGKLPISVRIVQEAVVGPTLGQASIKNGMISLVLGFLLVLAFMIYYYRRAGWVANLAMVFNLFLIIGVLSSLGAALTLPGMAGIVLTIGMSVDANVLIFERIREELKNGLSLRQAISDGYSNALSSIIDSNLTTLLTGIILLAFGKGPISGFAIILVIGILTSLFTAIFLTRLIFDGMLKREQAVTFGTARTISLFDNFNWNFIGKRKIAYMVSSIVILAGVVSLFTNGLNMSVDFEGGRSYIVEYSKDESTTIVRDELTKAFQTQPEVKTFGAGNVHKITTKYLIEEEGEEVDKKVETTLKSSLSQIVGADGFTILESQKVGPTFARDIKISAILSILVGLIGIFAYIVLRFRKWQYGLGALLALFHDVLVVIGLFSLLWKFIPINLEIDQTFIAAILTIVGYSINDTVVVFDRIRETLGLHKTMPLGQTINNALNRTISRTFMTSFTTIIVILVLFLVGGEILRGFSFALLIGITVGTYSSLFIASPMVVDLDRSKDKHDESKTA